MPDAPRPLTLEDVRAMDREQIVERWPEVARVLAGEPEPRIGPDTDWSTIDLASLSRDEIIANQDAVDAELVRRGRARRTPARPEPAPDAPSDPYADTWDAGGGFHPGAIRPGGR